MPEQLHKFADMVKTARNSLNTHSGAPAADVAPTGNTANDHTNMPTPGLSTEQALKLIRKYGEYGKALKRENSLRDVARKLGEIAQHAENTVMTETDDWFDKHTVNRNMKEIKKYVTEFERYANEADQLQERLSALYDDVGRILERYFDMEQDPVSKNSEEHDKELDDAEHDDGGDHENGGNHVKSDQLGADTDDTQLIAKESALEENIPVDESMTPKQRFSKFVKVWVSEKENIIEGVKVTPILAENVVLYTNQLSEPYKKAYMGMPSSKIVSLTTAIMHRKK